MLDPFLCAHTQDVLLFSISGRLRPGSIRDQIIRGTTVVRRAYEQGLIFKEGPAQRSRDVVVFGGGVAGVTSAMQASLLGIPTVLLPGFRGLFDRQAGCSTRWICPTECDWPSSHWNMRRYPWVKPAVPLSYEADYASTLAATWAEAFKQHLASGYPLQVSAEDRVIGQPYGTVFRQGNTLLRRVQTHRLGIRDFGIGIVAIGPGVEKCDSGSFKGTPFWHPDSLTELDWGITNKLYRILISGGGDGALQDTLRALLKVPASDAIRILNIPKRIQRRIAEAEDWASRAFAWGASNAHDHAALSDLQKKHEHAVRDFYNKTGVAERIESDVLRTTLPEVHLVYKCQHFGPSYAINRFLVLLLALHCRNEKFFGTTRTMPLLLRPKSFVAYVEGTDGHDCGKSHNSDECLPCRHQVFLADQPECVSTPPVLRVREPTVFGLVLLRHGTEVANPQAATGAPREIRHILPYHVDPE